MAISAGKIVKGLWGAFRPPGQFEGETDAEHEWRIGVTILQFCILGGLVVHWLLAAGVSLLGLSVSGYVEAGELADLQQSLSENSDLRTAQIDSLDHGVKDAIRLGTAIQINLLQDRICDAEAMGNVDAQRNAELLMREYQNQYRAVNHGEPYEVLECL